MFETVACISRQKGQGIGPVGSEESVMKTKIWTLMAGIAVSALALGASVPAQAGPIDLAVSTSPYDNAVPEIRVDGPTATGGYTEVTTKVNERISPIDVCNQNLALKIKNGTGQEFRKNGLTLIHYDAYEMKGHVSYGENTATKAAKDYNRSILVPIWIKCLPLDRPRPRENADTKGPPPREGKQMQPTIKQMTLRIEPAKVVQDGKFLCPSQLMLHGFVETRREFQGKALFVGPHYLSSIAMLDIQSKGTRNVSATYKMDWHKMGGLATAPNAEPKKQKLTFHFNISDKDGKLLKSVDEAVDVSCKKIKVNAPTAGNGMTVNPAN